MDSPSNGKPKVWWTEPPPQAGRAPRSTPKRARLVLLAMTGATVAFGAAAFIALEVAPVASGPSQVAASSASEQPDAADPAASGAAEEPAETKQVAKAADEADDSAAQAAVTTEPLEADNPRWAAADGTRRADEQHEGLEALDGAVARSTDERRAEGKPTTRANAYASAPPTETIEPAAPETDPAVAIAESEAEVAALEEDMRDEAASAAATHEASNEAADPAPSIATESLRAAVATDHVNMRARPGTDASVVLVVPKDAAIQADGSCESWCGATYDGQRGFIYRDYVRFEEDADAQQQAQPAPQEQQQSATAAESNEPEPRTADRMASPPNAR